MAIDRVGWDWSFMANEQEDHALVADEEAPIEFGLMAKTSTECEVFDNSLSSKNCKKNTESLNSKITNLTDKLSDSKNMLFHYKAGFVLDRNPSVPETKDSPSTISSKPFIKFVKAADPPTVAKSEKNKTVRKPSVKYAEQYRKPTKRSNGSSQNSIDDKGYWDSGCSRHMTGNISYLPDYEPFDRGYVSFGQGGCKITGKGTIKIGKLEFENMYFLKDLKFTRTFFLKTKDETSGILRKFITEIKNLKDLKVKIIRCDNGGEFRNKEMNDFCLRKWIKREFSNARTPQQNGVAERRNSTLIEAARTMLADAKLPVTFWAEAVNTACYVQNRVLVNKSHNKTPYELFNGRTPAIGFLKPFGCHVMILNTLDHLGKFEAKGDEGYFIGYSMSSKAFRVFNKITKRVEENLHVDFLENKAIEKGAGLNWLFDIDSLTKSMNYVPVVVAGTNSTNLSGTKDAASQEVKKDVSSLRYIALPNWVHDALLESSLSQPQDDCMETVIPTVSSPVPTACFTDSQEPSSDTRLISKRVANQVETPSLDNILTLTNRFEDILGVTTNSVDSDGVEADVSNMETTITASPTPTLRIHKDHPKSQIIGPVDTPIQTKHKSKELCREFEALMHEKIQMSAMDVRSSNTPMDKENPWGKEGTRKDVDLHLYRSMIRSLMYLTASRPDIMFTVCACARHQVTPTECHLHAVKRIFRYLKGHPKLVLWYPKESPFDYGGATQDRKSTTGGCQFLGRRLISWLSMLCKALSKEISSSILLLLIPLFWSTARIETTEEGTKILATIDGKLRTVSESSIWRNLKINDEAGINSLPNTKLFENLQLMGYNILPNQKFTFQKGQFSHQWNYLIHTIMQCLSPKSTGFNEFSSNISTALVCLATNRVYNFSKMIVDESTPHARRKGKETMVESETPKKKKVQEQIDIQLAKDLEEEMIRDTQRMKEQIAQDAEFARIHAEEELQMLIDRLDRKNETVAKYLQEYNQFAAELPIKRRIELISDLVKYQDNYAKVLKYLTQQRKPLTRKQQREFYTSVQRNQAGWKAKHFKGMTLEEIKEKFDLIIRLGGSSASYQFFVDMLKHFDREDLNQLWGLVKETLSIRPATKGKLYDSCGVHHVSSKDQDIFMLIEKDYPLRKGLAIVMISYKLQVENYSQMANDLIIKIYKIANSLRQQGIPTGSDEFPLPEQLPTTNEDKFLLLIQSDATARSSSYTVPTANETGHATSVSRHPTHSSEEEPTMHLKSKHKVSSFRTASVPTPTPAPIVALLQDPNVATGTFSLNDYFTTVLFDFGVDYSFISTRLLPLINAKPSAINPGYEIEIANGLKIETNNIFRGSSLNIEGFKAKIICHEKIVQILLSSGRILEVHKEHMEGRLKQLKTLKADRLEDIPVSIDERALHKREYDNMVNERQMQTTEGKESMIPAADKGMMHMLMMQISDPYMMKSQWLRQQSHFLNEKHNEDQVKNDIDVSETINIELEHKVAKLLKENKTLKKHYKELYDSIKSTRAKIIEQTTSLIAQNAEFKAQLLEKLFATAALKNKLRKLKRASVDTTFAKPSILGKPIVHPPRNQTVVRQPTALKSERHKFSKPWFTRQATCATSDRISATPPQPPITDPPSSPPSPSSLPSPSPPPRLSRTTSFTPSSSPCHVTISNQPHQKGASGLSQAPKGALGFIVAPRGAFGLFSTHKGALGLTGSPPRVRLNFCHQQRMRLVPLGTNRLRLF
uniref:Integrase catalytic domain-containing protein n=1 Tax=Tanacetum cinerariifolium TaxID=118510 RepID=A0A6L2JSR9_TANCI|nr:hypothetical protein [Tanacetum cinerariifolium]